MTRIPTIFRAPLRSVWRTALAPIRGRMRAEESDLAAQVPFAFAPQSSVAPAPRIAVICHLFHDDLAQEFRTTIDNLPASSDILISTDSAAKIPAIERAFAGWARGVVDIRVLPNRGRDIAPKLVGFADAYADHDLILFLHTKKSLTSSLGNRWRTMLLDTLCGSPAIVSSVLQIFERHPDIGIVMPQHFAPIRGLLHWDGNFRAARSLARRMGIPLRRGRLVDFPSGSMFWARPAALRPLLELGLTFDDFPAETNQVRDTIQHAVERLFLLVAERAGYHWVKIARLPSDGRHDTIRPIADRDALDAFINVSRLDLLPRARS